MCMCFILSLARAKTSQDVVNDLFAGVYSLLHHAYRLADTIAKPEVIKEDLDFLGIPAELQPALTSIIFSPRSVWWMGVIDSQQGKVEFGEGKAECVLDKEGGGGIKRRYCSRRKRWSEQHASRRAIFKQSPV